MLPCGDQWSLPFWMQMIFCVVGVFLMFIGLAHIIVQIYRKHRAKALQDDSAKVAEAQITDLEISDIESGTYRCSYEFEVDMPDDRVRRIAVKNRDLPRHVAEKILPVCSTKLSEACTAPVRFLPEDPYCCMLACNADSQDKKNRWPVGLGMLGIGFGILWPIGALACHGLSGMIASLIGVLLGVLYACGVVSNMQDPLREGATAKVFDKKAKREKYSVKEVFYSIGPSDGQKISTRSQAVADTIAA